MISLNVSGTLKDDAYVCTRQKIILNYVVVVFLAVSTKLDFCAQKVYFNLKFK